jgi:hypothetical protein
MPSIIPSVKAEKWLSPFIIRICAAIIVAMDKGKAQGICNKECRNKKIDTG